MKMAELQNYFPFTFIYLFNGEIQGFKSALVCVQANLTEAALFQHTFMNISCDSGRLHHTCVICLYFYACAFPTYTSNYISSLKHSDVRV